MNLFSHYRIYSLLFLLQTTVVVIGAGVVARGRKLITADIDADFEFHWTSELATSYIGIIFLIPVAWVAISLVFERKMSGGLTVTYQFISGLFLMIVLVVFMILAATHLTDSITYQMQ